MGRMHIWVCPFHRVIYRASQPRESKYPEQRINSKKTVKNLNSVFRSFLSYAKSYTAEVEDGRMWKFDKKHPSSWSTGKTPRPRWLHTNGPDGFTGSTRVSPWLLNVSLPPSHLPELENPQAHLTLLPFTRKRTCSNSNSNEIKFPTMCSSKNQHL